MDQVACAYNLYSEDGGLLSQAVVPGGPEGVFSNVLRFQYPVTAGLANTTLTVNLTCLDELQQAFASTAEVVVGPAEACEDCNASTDGGTTPTAEADEPVLLLPLGLAGLVAAVLGLTVLLRRRTLREAEKTWGEDDLDTLTNAEDLFEQESTPDLFEEEHHDSTPDVAEADSTNEASSIVPEGWTLEAYTDWLDGPAPEGWTEEQWVTYVTASKATLAKGAASSEG